MEYQFSNKVRALKPSAIREILKMSSDPSVISLSAGNPAAQAFPTQEIQRITQEIFAEDPILALQYSVTEGYGPLRETMKAFIAQRNGISGADDELIIVSGAQQGIELSCKALCDEGDTVLCENPSFVGALNAFRSFNTNLRGVPMDEDGISIGGLEQALKETPKARMLYVIPNFQNPSGITMSLEKRKAVYELACKYNVVILEDNPYGELRFAGEDIPAIKTLDREGRVIYCGSFSKILSPGLRVGYVAANPELISKIVVAKQAGDVHTSILSQLICYRFMKECDMPAHIERLRGIYRSKCSLMLDTMDACFDKRVTYTRPQGGLFIWCTLPGGSDMVGFCRRAVAEHKVAVVPGTAFTAAEGDPSDSFRVNFASPSDEDIVKSIGILGEMTKQI